MDFYFCPIDTDETEQRAKILMAGKDGALVSNGYEPIDGIQNGRASRSPVVLVELASDQVKRIMFDQVQFWGNKPKL